MFFTLRETRTFDTRGNSGLTGGLCGSAALCILTQYYWGNIIEWIILTEYYWVNIIGSIFSHKTKEIGIWRISCAYSEHRGACDLLIRLTLFTVGTRSVIVILFCFQQIRCPCTTYCSCNTLRGIQWILSTPGQSQFWLRSPRSYTTKPCHMYRQLTQFKQFIARCYLHKWWYFLFCSKQISVAGKTCAISTFMWGH